MDHIVPWDGSLNFENLQISKISWKLENVLKFGNFLGNLEKLKIFSKSRKFFLISAKKCLVTADSEWTFVHREAYLIVLIFGLWSLSSIFAVRESFHKKFTHELSHIIGSFYPPSNFKCTCFHNLRYLLFWTQQKKSLMKKSGFIISLRCFFF